MRSIEAFLAAVADFLKKYIINFVKKLFVTLCKKAIQAVRKLVKRAIKHVGSVLRGEGLDDLSFSEKLVAAGIVGGGSVLALLIGGTLAICSLPVLFIAAIVGYAMELFDGGGGVDANTLYFQMWYQQYCETYESELLEHNCITSGEKMDYLLANTGFYSDIRSCTPFDQASLRLIVQNDIPPQDVILYRVKGKLTIDAIQYRADAIPVLYREQDGLPWQIQYSLLAYAAEKPSVSYATETTYEELARVHHLPATEASLEQAIATWDYDYLWGANRVSVTQEQLTAIQSELMPEVTMAKKDRSYADKSYYSVEQLKTMQSKLYHTPVTALNLYQINDTTLAKLLQEGGSKQYDVYCPFDIPTQVNTYFCTKTRQEGGALVSAGTKERLEAANAALGNKELSPLSFFRILYQLPDSTDCLQNAETAFSKKYSVTPSVPIEDDEDNFFLWIYRLVFGEDDWEEPDGPAEIVDAPEDMYFGGHYCLPIDRKCVVTSECVSYRSFSGGGHYGMDIGGCGTDTPIYSMTDGIVLVNTTSSSAGNWVVIQSELPDGTPITIDYMHASKNVAPPVGQPVKAGQQIQVSGSTGWSTGPHLHIEITKCADNPATHRKDVGLHLNPRAFFGDAYGPVRTSEQNFLLPFDPMPFQWHPKSSAGDTEE